MSKLTFAEQIKHPEWQKRRLHMLEAAKWACTRCETKETTLNVHHRRYVKGRMYWEYSDEELQVLCEDCHAQEHADRELLQRIVDAAESDGMGISTVIGLAAGYLYGVCGMDSDLQNACLDVDASSFDLGVLSSIAGCARWSAIAKAADILAGPSLTPQQRNVIERWKAPPL